VELFMEQDPAYRARLLPEGLPVATIEAGCTALWRGLAGPGGLTLGIDHFGASAPAGILAEWYGFTADQVTKKLRDWLS
jgi:transketolase